MTVHIDYDGTIRIDGYVVGHVELVDSDIPYWGGHWIWTAMVNGTCSGSVAFAQREDAFKSAKEFCEQEAAVIR